MLEVRHLRVEPTQQARKRPRHARLLEARRQVDRLDSVGHELGVARHRGEVEIGRDNRQLAQEVQHVGLLAGAIAAEDIGVEDDHRSSSYTVRVWAATSCHVATRRGAGANALWMPLRIDSTSVGST